MLATPPSGLPGVKPAASAGYIPSLMKRSDQPMANELGMKARDAPSSAPPAMSSNGDAATPPPMKKQRVLIAPSSSSSSTAMYMIGASKQIPQSAEQIAKFQDFLTHVDSQYSTFKEQLFGGSLDANTLKEAFNQVNTLYHSVVVPAMNTTSGESSTVPNQGTYKEGFRDNPNTSQEMSDDAKGDSSKFDFSSVEEIAASIAGLKKANTVMNAGLDAVEDGAAFMESGGLTSFISGQLTSVGAGSLVPAVENLGLEAGLTALGGEVGLGAAAVGTIAGGAVLLAGIAVAGLAAYGLYKAFGGTETFSFLE